MLKISAIICTYNRSDYLSKAISSLLDQTLTKENYEILVIDNCSTDNTSQIAKELQSKYRNIRYFYEPTQGLSAARNRGIKEAEGELVAFLDDDATACREWLEEYIKVFKDYPNAGCAGGRIDLVWPDSKKPDWMPERFEQPYYGKFYKGEYIKKLSYPETPNGGNLCIRKEIINKIGVFNEKLGRKKQNLQSNEEFEFMERMRDNDIIYVPKAFVFHYVIPERVDRSYIFERAFWQGISDVKCEKINNRIKMLANISHDFKRFLKLSLPFYQKKNDEINRLAESQYFKGRISQEIKQFL